MPSFSRWIRSSGREIDQLDRVGAVEHRVRHGLAHAHVRDLGDDVVEALDVLDVDRGVDVDAAVEQLLDVEIALGMAAAGRIGMGELVDQHDLRAPRDDARRGPSPRATGPCSRRAGAG